MRVAKEYPAVLDLLRGRLDLLSARLDEHPSLVDQRLADLDFGWTVERRLTLRGATRLHVAAEIGKREAARLLIERGSDVDALAEADDAGVDGQTPIFHGAS